ncbi:MAG TPA: ABC transporter ATP-binding protein [Burkholderiales bacterium]|nr:ABC transporter ATP-binding protein [Burkholderiales bacterium]
MSDALLVVSSLCTQYVDERGDVVRAAQDVSFEVPQGKLFTLLGPSGCGKTTTLRSIAGLERPQSGEISVGGKVIYSSSQGVFVPPNRRGLGMVFQSYAIWPHMSVFQNAAFPLQVGKKKYSRTELEQRVLRVLKVVALDELADREATKLSGGQQQRLALARALVMEPALLLLDEPLSNLDAKLRERMRFELKRLQRDLGITTVYVTHDQSEALALSHSVAVMNAGRIEQLGSPREVYETPRNQFVADFIGSTNFVSGSVGGADAEAGFYVIRSELGELKARGLDTLVQGEQVVLSIRPEDIELTETKPQGANVYQGTVDQKVFLGESVDFQVRLGSRALQSRAHPSLRTPVGQAIFVRIDPEKCVALKASGEWARP